MGQWESQLVAAPKDPYTSADTSACGDRSANASADVDTSAGIVGSSLSAELESFLSAELESFPSAWPHPSTKLTLVQACRQDQLRPLIDTQLLLHQLGVLLLAVQLQVR